MYETFRFGPNKLNNGVLWSKCDVPHHHVLYMCDAKRDFATCFTNGTALNFIRCMIFGKFHTKLLRHYGEKSIVRHATVHRTLVPNLRSFEEC